MSETILYLKLITGEDIVTLVESNDEEFLYIVDPIKLHSINSSNGALLRATKWIPYIDQDDMGILLKHIL